MAAPVPGEQLVDMVVAEVASKVITLSELIAEAQLVVVRAHGPDVAAETEMTRDLLRSVLVARVHREQLLAEIRRLQLREAPLADVEAAYRQLQRRFVSEGDLGRFLEAVGLMEPGATLIAAPPALASLLRSEIEAERFIEARVRLGIEVSDAEVARCAAKLGGPNATKKARDTLRAAREAKALLELLDRLADRAPARYARGWEPPPPLAEAPPCP